MKPFAIALPLILAGCAAEQARYPSLLPRAAEKTGFDEPALAAPAPVAADPALDARLGGIAGKLDAVTRGFDADLAKAQTAAAVPGARTVGSEAWLSAQAALAALDDWRSQATGLATDLEALVGERLGSVGTPYSALDAMQARAAAEAERQAGAIGKLTAALPTP